MTVQLTQDSNASTKHTRFKCFNVKGENEREACETQMFGGYCFGV